MKRFVGLIMPLTLCILFTKCLQAESVDDPNNNMEKKIVTIEDIELDVNDTNFELRYKIKNNTDHDVWICDGVGAIGSLESEVRLEEVYLAKDNQTLMIRRRLDVPTAIEWLELPNGRYVRLRSGQERAESLSLTVPVQRRVMFASGLSGDYCATRLVLEIGFYNEDLHETIHDILEVAEKLNCAYLDLREYYSDTIIHYFKGIFIQQLFGSLSEFEKEYKEQGERILIQYNFQGFISEKVLCCTLDDVNIPYRSSGIRYSSVEEKAIDEKKRVISTNEENPRIEERNDTDKS